MAFPVKYLFKDPKLKKKNQMHSRSKYFLREKLYKFVIERVNLQKNNRGKRIYLNEEISAEILVGGLKLHFLFSFRFICKRKI